MILILTESATSETKVHFEMYKSDELCVNINSILSPQQFFNDFSVGKNPDFQTTTPDWPPKITVPDVMKDQVKDSSIIDVTVFGKAIAGLVKAQSAEVGFQFFGVRSVFESSTSQTTTTIHALGFGDKDCKKIFMDEHNLYSYCFVRNENRFEFITVDYENEGAAGMERLFENLPENHIFESVDIEMDFHNGKGDNKLFAFYAKSAHKNYGLLQHTFVLKNMNSKMFLQLHPDDQIISISISNYDHMNSIADLIIMVSKDGLNEFRHYRLIDLQFTHTNGNPYELVDVKGDSIYSQDRSVFIFKSIENKGLEMFSINLKNKKYPKFVLENQKGVTQFRGSGNMFVFETEDAVTQKRNWFFLDTSCDRLYKKGWEDDQIVNKKWVIAHISYKTYYVVFNGNSLEFQEIFSFQKVCTNFDGSKLTHGKVDYLLNGKPLLSADIDLFEYEEIDLKAIENKQIIVSKDGERERQVELNIQGNDLKFSSSSNVYFFHELNYNSYIDRNQCNPIRVLLKKGSMIQLCSEVVSGENLRMQPTRILFLSNFNLDFDIREYGFLTQKVFEIERNVGDKNIIDLHQVVDMKYLFKQFLIFLDSENVLWVLDVSVKEEKMEISKTTDLQNFESCKMKKHRLICKQGEYFLVYQLVKRNDRVHLELVEGHKLQNTLFNSIVISNYLVDSMYYIRRSFTADNRYHLIIETNSIGQKISKPVNNLGPDSYLAEISKDQLLVVNFNNGNVEVTGIIGYSHIEYPFYFKELVYSIRKIIALDEMKMFSILYDTVEGSCRLYIGRSSLDVNERVVQDLLLDKCPQSLKIDHSIVKSNQVMFVVYDTSDPNYRQSFILFSNGPIFYIPKHSNKIDSSFVVNDRTVQLDIQEKDFSDPLEVKTRDVSVDNPQSDVVLFPLESERKLEISGGLLEIEENETTPYLTILQRLNLKDQHKIRFYGDTVNDETPHHLTSSKNDFSFLFKGTIHSKNQKKSNNLIKECKFVTNSAGSTTQRQLCKDVATNENVLSNFGTENLLLNNNEDDLRPLNLVETNDLMFFSACNKGSKMVRIWRFKREKKGFELQTQRTLNADDFFLSSKTIEFAFVSTVLIEEKMVILIHEEHSNEVIFKVMDLNSNVYESFNHIRVPFEVDGSALPIHSLNCHQLESSLECFIRSDSHIYDTQLVRTEGRTFSFIVKTTYPFNKNVVVGNKIALKWTKRFLAVYTRSPKDYDVFVFKRDHSVSKNNLYGAIPLEANSKITKVSISDWSESVEGKPVEKTSIFLGQFSMRKDKTHNYAKLNVLEFEVDEFRLRVNTELTSLSEVFKIKGKDFEGHYHPYQFEVKMDHNAKQKGLVVTSIILLIVFIASVVAFVYVFRENKKLKMSFLEENRDQDNFNDITVLRV